MNEGPRPQTPDPWPGYQRQPRAALDDLTATPNVFREGQEEAIAFARILLINDRAPAPPRPERRVLVPSWRPR
jgi:hypothetical protein